MSCISGSHHSKLHHYHHDKEMIHSTVDTGKKLFAAPKWAAEEMFDATERCRNPVAKFAGGAATIATPVLVAPFSTVAGILTFTVGVPVLAAKAGIDRCLGR